MAKTAALLASTYRNSDWVDDDPERKARFAQWLGDRCGCLTASRMKDAMDFTQKGLPSAKRSDYQRELLSERLTGFSTRHFVTAAMQHGIDTEPEAKLVYAAITGAKLHPGEFIEHPTIPMCGCTPDAFVGDDGLVEIKCPQTSTYMEWVLRKEIPEEHKPQMILQLACTKRAWCDFMAFDPRLKEEKYRYFIRRFVPTSEETRRVEEFATRFVDEVEEMFSQFIEAMHG